MQKKHDLYKNRYELYNCLFTESCIDGMLNIAENFLNNPIFILDTSYRIITRSNLAKSENSSIEVHNGENYLLPDIINLMKKNKCIDNIYKNSNSFFHYADLNLIFCAIRINNITIGYIGVLQSKRDFQEEDLELTNILSKVLSIQIQKENLFVSNSGLDEEYYLMNLLVNNIASAEHAAERLKNSNFILKRNLTILSVPYKQKYKDYRHNFGLRQLIERIKAILRNCISTYYDDKIIFLIGSDEEQLFSEHSKNALLDFLRLNNLRCGLSINFNNLSDVQDFFQQSLYALKLSSYMKRNDYINFFENYAEYYLFYIATKGTEANYKLNLLNLVHPWIKKLMNFDKKNNTELFITLKTYLENNRNANETSEKLNIHRSTLFYRFNKIKSLLEISLEDNDNLLKLELSLKIINYTSSLEKL